MRTLRTLLICFVFGYATVAAQAACIQDQYGNQYNFTIDQTHAYVYGTVTNAQGCSSSTWNLTGVWSNTPSGGGLELTASNPTPDNCVPMYTLKGVYPAFDWFYDTGYGTPQPSTYVACGTQVAKDVVGKGSLK